MASIPVCPSPESASNLALSERERERELDKYFRSAGIEPVCEGVERALAEGGRSSDATLTALAQLGSLKLQCERSFISLIDTTHQYIIGEATRSHALQSDHVATPADAIYLGVRAIELHWGVCPTTIQVFTGARKSFTSDVVTADPNHYIIRDFTADPCYSDREYIVGWPYMRSYLEVPLRLQGGAVIGSYCVVHTEPRDFSQLDIQTLAEIGDCIVDHLNLLRIKQEYERSQQLIQGLGTIVAGSLDPPLSAAPSAPFMQNHYRNARLISDEHDAAVPDEADTSTPNAIEVGIVDRKAEEPNPSTSNNIADNLEKLRVEDASTADSLPQRAATSQHSSPAPSKPETDVLFEDEGERRCETRQGSDDDSMFADITTSIYQNTGVDGVLILDAQVANTFADSPYSLPTSKRNSRPEVSGVPGPKDSSPLICLELGACLKPKKEHVTVNPDPKQLPSSVLHGLLSRYPAGTVLRREKDAPLLDKYMHNQEWNKEITGTVSRAPSEEELLFDYLKGPLQIILAPMWAASHRNGPLCIVSWTRDRARSFGDEDVALLSAFCNSAVANLARKDAISTMQTKSKFMESISHELRSPIHAVLASAELLETQYTDTESRSLLSNIQISGVTLLDTMNQLLVFTEISNQDSPFPRGDAIVTTNSDLTSDDYSINLGTLVEEVVDTISVGHTFKESHGKDLELKRKRLASVRTLHNALAGITTAITIHPEAAKVVRAQVGSLRRLLMILYSNALNFTSHGHIEVELCLVAEPGETTGRAVQLIVRDSGRGISQSYQDSRMFLPFSQEHTNSAGVGLGLSIAQRFVHNFGGTLKVDSEEGIGTTMEVTIPFGTHLALEERPKSPNLYLPMLLRDYVKGRSVCLVNLAEMSGHSKALPKPSIYDSTNIVLARSLNSTLLECFGMHIVTEADSPQAILEIACGEVFISRGQTTETRKLKIQNPISPRTIAAALVNTFDLASTLDNETRDMLQIYQPLESQKVRSPVTASALTPDHHDAPLNNIPKPTPLVDEASGESETVTNDNKSVANCLLVDDNEVNLKVLGACMKNLGYSHTFAADGKAAVEAFRARESGPFDLVFMDLSMPVMDGFEATKQIRATEEQMAWPPAKIIVLSAFGTNESKEMAMKCGCDLFLIKPASPKKIRETVKLLDV